MKLGPTSKMCVIGLGLVAIGILLMATNQDAQAGFIAGLWLSGAGVGILWLSGQRMHP